MSIKPSVPVLAFVSAAALILAACSTDGADDDHNAATSPIAESESSTTTSRRTPSTIATSSAVADDVRITCENLTPCAASISAEQPLSDGDLVTVSIEGWLPDEGIGLVQCADPDGSPAGSIDSGASGLPFEEFCDGAGFTEIASDSEGTVTFEFRVLAGASMAERTEAGVTCDAEHACMITVFAVDEERFDRSNPRLTLHLEFA